MVLVGVDEILARPDKWNGRSAAVLGLFTYAPENVTLAVSETDSRCLWIDLVKSSMLLDCPRLTSARLKESVVEGVIEVEPSGHFGMFPGQITKVLRIVPANEWTPTVA